MGHSYLRFRGQVLRQSDGFIECWLYVMAQRLPPDPRLDAARQYWSELCRYGWTGFVAPDFDRYLADDEVLKTVRELAVSIAQESVTLTASELNREGIGGPESQWTSDLLPSALREPFSQIAALLSGRDSVPEGQ